MELKKIKSRESGLIAEAVQFTKENKDQVFNWVRCNISASFDCSGEPILRIQEPHQINTCRLFDWIVKIENDYIVIEKEYFNLRFEEV